MNILFAIFISLLPVLQQADANSLLTGKSAKLWTLHASTAATDCPVTNRIHSDNTYTFYSNGTFEFDHGAITEDPNCKENCCSDMVNLIGTWKFRNGKKGIRVWSTGERGNDGNKFNLVLFDAIIEVLDEQTLRLRQTDPETKAINTIEFRSK
jgi:hypothetical protein